MDDFSRFNNMDFKNMTPQEMVSFLEIFLMKNCANLEECELNMQRCFDEVDKILSDKYYKAPYSDKFNAAKISWAMYKDYKNLVVPEAHKVIEDIQNLLNFFKENKNNF